MTAHSYEEENGSAAMLTTRRSAGVTPDMNLIDCVTHTPPPNANKAAHSGFETQRRCHQKSKTRESVAPHKKALNFFEKVLMHSILALKVSETSTRL